MPKMDGGPAAPRVLLIMDDPLANLVKLTLGHVAVETDGVRTAREAVDAVRTLRPHLVIVDYDREADGLQLVQQADRSIPVIAMTRKRETAVKLKAFDMGAHDIIEVPFTPDEIVARTVAAMRRVHDIGTPIIRRIYVGELQIDVLGQTAEIDGAKVELTPLQHTLLYMLAANDGEILTRDQIILNIWGAEEAVASNVVDRHVRDLRVKLQDSWKQPRFIETVPGRGYRFMNGSLQGGPREGSAP
jgi:DNA-binding response OmpR family regulator